MLFGAPRWLSAFMVCSHSTELYTIDYITINIRFVLNVEVYAFKVNVGQQNNQKVVVLQCSYNMKTSRYIRQTKRQPNYISFMGCA